MSNYILSCCTTADMSKTYFEERNIIYCPFHYYMDDVHYYDDLWQSMSYEEFYQRMVDGAQTRTSQINAEEFVEIFTPYLEQGTDIFHVTLSSGISGVYNSAMIAKELLEEKYPDRKVYVVDSLNAAGGYGLFMDALADLRDEGMDAESLYKWAIENRLKLNAWFFTSDLTFFIKGGRVSKTAGFVGSVLNICPLLNINFEGKLIPREKIRTKKKVIARIVDKMAELCEDGENYNKKCYISCSVCEEDAEAVASLIKERFKNLKGDVLINPIGTTIGSHTGPGTVAVFFWGEARQD